MFTSSTARLGSICGWTPADDHHDTLYTTIPTPAGPSSSQLTLASSPSNAPRSTRNSLPRSLSLDSAPEQSPDDCRNISRFKNATSLRRYKVKRSKDPQWAPRPPNAFILFRREFVERHKGEQLSTEKITLSKRAGQAWRSLTTDEQKRYFDLAKIEADEHLRRNPGYQFRPNKHARSESRRHPAFLSRREQVEEFIRKTTRRRVASRAQRSQCPTPGSAGSATSPELPGTPLSHDSRHLDSDSRSQSRSSSVSRQPQVACPIPLAPGIDHGLLSAAIQSTPSLVPERPLFPAVKRTASYTDGAEYSPWDFVALDDYTESDDQSSQSFDSFTTDHSSAASFTGEQPPPAYFGDTSPEHLSHHEYGAPLQMPDPLFMPIHDLTTSSQAASSTSYIPPTSSPLFERRRRAATTSMIPSPLTVITSSLSGWARDDMATARMAPPPYLGSLPLASAQTAQGPQPTQSPQVQMSEEAWSQPMHPAPSPSNLLTVPIPEIDMDSTPRLPTFLQNSQSTVAYSAPPLPPSMMLPVPEVQFSIVIPEHESPLPMASIDPFDLTTDLESYNMGLRTYGISLPHEPYGTPGDVDYTLLYCSNLAEQQC